MPMGVVLLIIEFIIEIKCRDLFIRYRHMGGICWGMKGCSNHNCRLRHFCEVYKNTIMPEALEEMERLLESRRKEIEQEQK